MGTSTSDQAPLSRKARRKQERKARKQKKAPKNAPTRAEESSSAQPPDASVTNRKVQSKTRRQDVGTEQQQKQAKRRKLQNGTNKKDTDDLYDNMNPALAAAIRRDDEEIAALEAKLGLGSAKEKARLNREYAKLEGYGEDFGDFLDDLDNMVRRVIRNDTNREGKGDDHDEYDGLLRGTTTHDDDDESTSLESPYHSSDDEEQMTNEDDLPFDDDEDSMEEEELPMKAPGPDKKNAEEEEEEEDENDDDDDDDDDDDEAEDDGEANGSDSERFDHEKEAAVDDEANHEAEDLAEEDNSKSDNESFGDDDNNNDEVDPGDTYRPIRGEDIYGKAKNSEPKVSAAKYVPPHLRNKHGDDLKDRQESLRVIERLLNNSLNRLSEDTVLSVAQTIAKLYESHSKSDLNDSLWKITRNTCVERSFLMTGLTPVYVAALVGVHYFRSNAQLAEHLMELVTTTLCEELDKQQRLESEEIDQDTETISKKACNLALVLCYLYNFGVVHCNLLYDIIRKLIASFHEVDVEVLLIFLSHCGRSLRSDDPLALKEIVLEVQKRAVKDSTASSSRVDYMMSAMMDLKNNKRRAQDVAFADKTSKLRKSIGHIKSRVATSNGKANDNSLRITLKDIMEADSRGRWWRVGASWAGNQFTDKEGEEDTDEDATKTTTRSSSSDENDERLLKLASKYRMNSDIRRSIFCIIMGAADCDDAFEKIVRAGVLKNRNERDTVRVLMECCSNEKVYNKFYEHLASRICEYQGRCRFTFQLAFWDIFKQFDEMNLRKAANLAKLLFALVAQHQILKLNVLKAIDMTTPEEIPETATIFLTIFFTNLLEYFQDETGIAGFFDSAIHQGNKRTEIEGDEDDDMGATDEAEALRASFTLFFVQVLKSSPKYKKGSKFRSNLKAAIKACDTDNFF